MQHRAPFLFFTLSVSVVLTLTSCSDQHSESRSLLGPESAGRSASLVPQQQKAKPLIPAAPDVFVVDVLPGSDPQEVADRYGWTVERVLSGNVVVYSAVFDPTDLDNDADIVEYEINQPVSLAFGQELTMGFFEGEIFEITDLRPNFQLFGLGYDWREHLDAGHGVRVGIIDTGADGNHPLLVDQIVAPVGADWLGWEEYADSVDNDLDGLIDEAYGHGTFVAGMVAQLAPAATIIPVRALNSDGFGSLADVLSAMDVLEQQGIDILNLSMSLSDSSNAFEERLILFASKGILVVAAAGNQGGVTSYPARSPLALGVAAVETHGVFASFSNRDRLCELAAPGVGLLSSYPDRGLGWGSGTSFAAPIVTGALATSISYGGGLACLLDGVRSLEPLHYGELVTLDCVATAIPGNKWQIKAK